jgi:hypothetical protein
MAGDSSLTAMRASLAVVASELLARLPDLSEQLVERIMKQADCYGDDAPVPRADLYASCRDNLEFMIRHLANVGPYDLSAPRRTGRRRAEQGAPLADVQTAFRIGFAFMWDCVVAEARRSGAVPDCELVRVASNVWTLNEMFNTEMASAYRDALTEQLLRQSQERSALVTALLEGRVADIKTVWEVADLLALPYHGSFVLVAADVPGLARQALPDIENRLRARDMGSAWQLLPDLHVGIVSLRADKTLAPLVTMLRAAATARIGLSPVYTGLEKTAQALHLARIAMASVPPDTAEVCVFDNAPVPVLVASSPTTSYQIVQNVLGPLLEVAAEERKALLDTLDTYFAVRGSAAEAGKRLYCHPNTVRHRLRRIEQKTGRSLEDPLGSAELYIALQAMRRLPDRSGLD